MRKTSQKVLDEIQEAESILSNIKDVYIYKEFKRRLDGTYLEYTSTNQLLGLIGIDRIKEFLKEEGFYLRKKK